MALKILVAGVDKDERSAAEGTVKEALGWRALEETWTVSLVKMGAMWSVTLDGPDERFRGLSFVTSSERLAEAVLEIIERKGGGAPPAQATDSQPATAPPEPSPPPAATPATPPAAMAQTPPVPSPPTPQPTTPAPRPAAPASVKAAASAPQSPVIVPGEHRDRHQCEHCHAAFAVVYEMQANDSLQLVPVACPHCWKINLVEIGSWAAGGRDYRADKA